MIIALDPGGTTGAARIEWPLTPESKITTQELTDELDVWAYLVEHMPMGIVMESFFWQKRHSVDFAPLHIIGVVRLFGQMHGIRIKEQSPSQKGFWSNDKLKRVGEYVKGSEHERDAVRHLLYFLSFTTGDERWLRKLKK